MQANKATVWSWLIVLCILVSVLPFGVSFVAAAQTQAIPISTPQELLDMSKDPAGSYILMQDLDMTGVAWKSLDFSGSFDGNGHAILNLQLFEPGDDRPSSCDGNRKLYETSYVGLFGTVRNAQVKNLKLLNVRAVIESDMPCFVAGIAGYAENSTITGCTVIGTLELRAFDRIFGVGGVVGYGSGAIKNCQVDVTLICTDTDANTKDEQFLGGVYATGFMDVEDCQVTIDGYVSDHGYVHNGGIVGMYMEYPFGVGKSGYIMRNSVTGKITFFEDNPDRRAYCKAIIGEALASRYYVEGNTEDFQRDERWDTSAELRPEMCPNPAYHETVTIPGCSTYGYTQYRCKTCGYTYTDRYTKFSHMVTQWTVTQEPTVETEGLSTGICDFCGMEFQRTVPVLTHTPVETAPATQPTEETAQMPIEPQPSEKQPESKLWIYVLICALAVGSAVLLIVLLPKRSSGGKYQRRKR